jgi:two-component system chemotaxis response regulator CheB
MSLGAADTLPKPGAGNFGGRFSEVLGERLRRIGRVQRFPAGGAKSASVPDAPPLKLRPMTDQRLGCLALGASTGGLHALSEFLRALPTRISAPILITQHLPTVFMPFFARQIEAASGRLSRVAENGMTLTPEQILVAPGDAHLALERIGSRIVVQLTDAPASSGCMPSVDTMLWSVSEIYGRSGIGVVFSGMGRDGLVGSARIVDRGGAVLVQNQQSSAVWGMPRAVAEAGLASAVLAPAELAVRVASRAESSSWR